MKENKIHRNILLFVYIFFNAAYVFIYALDGHLGGDLSSLSWHSNLEILFFSFFLVLISIIFFNIGVFTFVNKVNIGKRGLIHQIPPSMTLHVLFFFIFIFYIFSISKGLGVNGVADENVKNVGSVFKYTFFLLQPHFLLLIYIFCFAGIRNFLYKIIVVGYFLSPLITGAMSTYILLLPYFVLCHKSGVNNARFNYLVLFFVVLGFVLAPLLRIAKFVALSLVLTNFNSSFESVNFVDKISSILISMVGDEGFLGLYFDFAIHTFERFQVVANIQYLIDNSIMFESFYYDFFRTHSIINFTYQLFCNVNESALWIESVVANKINPDISWNVHVSFWGRMIVSGVDSLFIYIFIVFLVLTSVFLSKKISPNLNELTWCYVLLFVIHGWFLAFFLFVQTVFMFIFLLYLVRFFHIFFIYVSNSKVRLNG
ncbi:hypothetical protein SAMN05421840_101468 [Shewanella morhuae]|uniref:oligosaccharide repeat unit polymerase n=1 Tax=Shewanella morhuae TaxID=365591 RepID=UPI000954A349|nr:oligosaccharide repeat unit polymerase [Shewanella morhuae]SIQ50870.1 hypothetical protein SAMN05421840_101468 [Shewanella morhuae]